jgi:hypothetical protein
LSVDAFADMYPSLTPYQYTANNPVNLIDVNGDSIVITGDDHAAAFADLQSAAGTDGCRLSVGENDILVINLKGYESGSNPKLDALIMINNSSSKIGYGVSKAAISKSEIDINGNIIGSGISNSSITHRYAGLPNQSNLPHGLTPPPGLHGQSIISKQTRWEFADGTNVPRGQIVGHEVLEVYHRSHNGMNYFDAHKVSNDNFFGGNSTMRIITKPIVIIK